MKPFTNHRGLVAPLDRPNVDMDQIISKEYLKNTGREGYAPGLFYNWRFTYSNDKKTDFFLNDPKYAKATILLTRENFGCGSSWEHACWALQDYGFKVILSPSFADIFYINCFNVGLLPVCLEPEDIDQLFSWTEKENLNIEVDLEKCTVQKVDGNWVRPFKIEEYHREALLKGFLERDQIKETLKEESNIGAFESSLPAYIIP